MANGVRFVDYWRSPYLDGAKRVILCQQMVYEELVGIETTTQSD